MPDLHSPAAWLRTIARNTKRAFVFILRVAILLAGVAMLALPGPGVLVILVGLFVLASEFAWAERVLDRTTSKAAGVATKATEDRRGQLLLAIVSTAWRVAGHPPATAGMIETVMPSATWVSRPSR